MVINYRAKETTTTTTTIEIKLELQRTNEQELRLHEKKNLLSVPRQILSSVYTYEVKKKC
jgi:hypothetical protein